MTDLQKLFRAAFDAEMSRIHSFGFFWADRMSTINQAFIECGKAADTDLGLCSEHRLELTGKVLT